MLTTFSVYYGRFSISAACAEQESECIEPQGNIRWYMTPVIKLIQYFHCSHPYSRDTFIGRDTALTNSSLRNGLWLSIMQTWRNWWTGTELNWIWKSCPAVKVANGVVTSNIIDGYLLFIISRQIHVANDCADSVSKFTFGIMSFEVLAIWATKTAKIFASINSFQ